jgi:hypothetical protein
MYASLQKKQTNRYVEIFCDGAIRAPHSPRAGPGNSFEGGGRARKGTDKSTKNSLPRLFYEIAQRL